MGLSAGVRDSNQGILTPKGISKTCPCPLPPDVGQELRFPGCLHCVLIHLNLAANPPVISAFGGEESPVWHGKG